MALLCQGQIAPDFAGVELGMAERLAARAVAQAASTTAEQVLAGAREVGDLGLTAEQLLGEQDPDRAATLEVGTVFEGLHEVAQAEGRLAGPQAGRAGRPAWPGAPPLEARYLVRTVTGSLRLGIGTATILDGLAEVHAGGRKQRQILERAYNICSDLSQVAATLVSGGLAEVERMEVRAGNPVRPMLAQRMSSSAEIPAKLGGTCAAEYKYDGIRVQAHRTADGALELYTRRLDRVSTQFPEVVKLLDQSLGRARRSWRARSWPSTRPRGAAPVPGRDVPAPQVRHHRGRQRLPREPVLLRAAVRRRHRPHAACPTWNAGRGWPRRSRRQRGCG